MDWGTESWEAKGRSGAGRGAWEVASAGDAWAGTPMGWAFSASQLSGVLFVDSVICSSFAYHLLS